MRHGDLRPGDTLFRSSPSRFGPRVLLVLAPSPDFTVLDMETSEVHRATIEADRPVSPEWSRDPELLEEDL